MCPLLISQFQKGEGGFEDTESNSTYSDVTSDGQDDTSASSYPSASLERGKSFEERLEPLLGKDTAYTLSGWSKCFRSDLEDKVSGEHAQRRSILCVWKGSHLT